ncbi:P-loop containing nucleoside triphosphate hydrolase protein [Coprinopsis sp. MPI-PUGE-AT-0042]|nr:P-loop containing nucleoside triphosphate hydrolase protein [Coprinopsis sp. MPI-PUGE-AT-0042]
MAPNRKWLKQRRPTDNLIKGGRETDFIVVIMGPTGVGKSTFMNHVAGSTVTTVGHALASCTQEIQYYTIDNAKAAGFDLAEGRRLVLVDTPGFNDTYIDDSEILRRVAVWLASSYDSGMKLGGVMYLYDISAKRLTGSVHLNLKMFEKLCGSKAFDKIVIGTTKWSAAGDDHAALYRLAELKKEYWAGLLDKGAKDLRIDNERESCKRGVNALLAAGSNQRQNEVIRRALKIQQELVEEEKLVPRTEAGKTLNYSMKDMLKAKKQELAETKNAQQRGKVQGEIDWLKGQIDDLHTGFFQRLKWWLT